MLTGRLLELHEKTTKGSLDLLEPSPDDGNSALHWLMRFNSEESKEILQLHFDTSDECSPMNFDQCTPLHTAVSEDNMEMVTLLINNGAHLEAQDLAGRTPLELAIVLGRSVIAASIKDNPRFARM